MGSPEKWRISLNTHAEHDALCMRSTLGGGQQSASQEG